jgi:hypothetical protein
MRDYFSETFEWDEDGNKRRKKRVARDREQIHFPVTAMDAMRGSFHPTFSDGSHDHTSPFKPGFRFADVGDAARLAADEAYEARRERMENAWRTKRDVKAEDNRDGTPPHTQSLDELRAAADQAWEERNRRMSSAWRNRHD